MINQIVTEYLKIKKRHEYQDVSMFLLNYWKVISEGFKHSTHNATITAVLIKCLLKEIS